MCYIALKMLYYRLAQLPVAAEPRLPLPFGSGQSLPLPLTGPLGPSAAPRHCAPLPAALPEPQSSEILRAACAHSAAHSRRTMPEHVRARMGRAWPGGLATRRCGKYISSPRSGCTKIFFCTLQRRLHADEAVARATAPNSEATTPIQYAQRCILPRAGLC